MMLDRLLLIGCLCLLGWLRLILGLIARLFVRGLISRCLCPRRCQLRRRLWARLRGGALCVVLMGSRCCSILFIMVRGLYGFLCLGLGNLIIGPLWNILILMIMRHCFFRSILELLSSGELRIQCFSWHTELLRIFIFRIFSCRNYCMIHNILNAHRNQQEIYHVFFDDESIV